MKIKYFLLSIILLISIPLYSQNDGSANTGLSFLKLGIGARSIAMGEAYSSVAEDATAYIYNPAGLYFINNNNVTVSYNSAMLDLKNSFIATKFNIGKLAVGVGLLKSGVDDIEIRSTPGTALDKFNSSNISAGISFSYAFFENFAFGLTTKFIYEKIFVDETSGIGIDLGTFYKKQNLNLSFVISNLGSMGELRNEKSKLPSLVRFGGSYYYSVKDFKFIFAVEGNKVIDGGLFHINTGIEAGYKDFVFLRAGYQTNYENKGISAGLGFKYKQFTVDYAFIPYSYSFGTGNTFSIGFNF